jgi:hypothetical protein
MSYAIRMVQFSLHDVRPGWWRMLRSGRRLSRRALVDLLLVSLVALVFIMSVGFSLAFEST